MFRHIKRFILTRFRSRRRAAARWQALVRTDEKGQSAVEMALCLPVMLLVVTGITTFGIAMNNYLQLTNSTSSGARMVALSRGVTTDPCADIAKTVVSSAPLLKGSSLTYSLAITPSGGSTTTYSGNSCASAAAALTQNATAQVTVTYPCNLQVYGKNFAPSCNMQGMDAELVQ